MIRGFGKKQTKKKAHKNPLIKPTNCMPISKNKGS